MQKSVLMGVTLIAALLAGCETNPALTQQINKTIQTMAGAPPGVSAPSSALTSTSTTAPVTKTATMAPSSQDHYSPNTAADGGPAGLIGKVITLKNISNRFDSSKPRDDTPNINTEYGNDYYPCFGEQVDAKSMHSDIKSYIGIEFLRKGIKTKCNGLKIPLYALTKTNANNKTVEILDVLTAFDAPKGYIQVDMKCEGAIFAIAKRMKTEYLTTIIKAWKIENSKFSPVTNLSSVKCGNPDFYYD
jgi:hypothetical protein